MAIVVVCPSCHARFQVSEKFAGLKGPCPKCKNQINIPKLEDEVKIHAPEDFAAGGKDTKGRPVLKPIERVEAKVNPVVTVIVLAAIALSFGVAFMMRSQDFKDSLVFLGVSAALVAPLVSLGGYTFLRNQELEPYTGGALAVRVLICSIVYAGLFGAMWALKHFLMGEGPLEVWSYFVLFGPPAVIGSLTALGTLDLDFGSGFFHYALYLGTCILLRLTAGLSVM
jgi:predicted Zn finger-like uncharacterized protein